MDESTYLGADRFPLVRDMGWNQTTSLYTHPDRTLDYDVFIYVTAGTMQVIEEGQEYVVQQGQFLFLRQGRHHWGLPQTPAGTAWYWIHFHTVFEESIAYKDYPPLPELGFYYPNYYEYRFPLPKYGYSPVQLALENRLQLLLEHYDYLKEHWMTQSSLRVYQLLMDLQEAWNLGEQESVRGKSEHTARKVMAYLTEHCGEEFAGDKLSLYMKMNYSYLSAMFKQRTGQTIIETHTKLRMNKAIGLMRSTSLNISEISESLGYPNPYYFSRVFKKVLGEAPSAYLKHLYR
ncbi:AraC family transcriptional regulator [Paenibacillus monticola]|uniref:Helix-turn-helix domain-containing protein n=1 Tax=Paenibacillus monticola TaxID=2666075 RepID=A0A7X2H7A0_9BACL|nr:helix-turn-helix domain-containing protein [Paenibacillus monticola]